MNILFKGQNIVTKQSNKRNN